MRIILSIALCLFLAGCGAKQAALVHIDDIDIPSNRSKSGDIVLNNGVTIADKMVKVSLSTATSIPTQTEEPDLPLVKSFIPPITPYENHA